MQTRSDEERRAGCTVRRPRRSSCIAPRDMVKRRDQRGVALIFVLWLLVVLGAIVAEVAREARLEAAMLASLRARTVARYAAESGILAATVRIEAMPDSAHGSTEPTAMFRELNPGLPPLSHVELGTPRS